MQFKVITKKQIIDNVHLAWIKQYPQNSCDEDKKVIFRKLKKLNPRTEESIIETIGNDTWTRNRCNHCGKDSEINYVIDGYCKIYDDFPICSECIKKLYEFSVSSAITKV